jgi:hypothetical protein
MSARLTTMVTSPPDRAHIVVELWNGDIQVGEVSRSSAGLLVELYSHPSGRSHLVAYAELVRVLEAAAAELGDEATEAP